MYKLLGAYIRSGNLKEGFHITSLAGLYLEGIYLIVVNLNPTETENERVESCARACRWKPILWAQRSTSCNNQDNLRLPWRGSFLQSKLQKCCLVTSSGPAWFNTVF